MSVLWIGWAYKKTTGSASAKAILVKIADNANDDGIAWPSIKTIAEHVELSPRAVQNNIRRLADDGFLKIEERYVGGVQLPNFYQLIETVHETTGGVNDLQGGGRVQQMQGGGAADAGGGGAAGAPKPSVVKPSTVSNSVERSFKEDFQDWYEHYPRRVARGAAEKALAKAMRDGATLEALIEGTKRYAAQVEGKEAQYIKHPSTWLNGQCWLDEQDPPPKADLTWWEKRQLEEERRAELAAGV